MKTRTAWWLLLLMVEACASSPPPTAATLSITTQSLRPGPVDATLVPDSLALSGGVSLGAYEAGGTWAILELRRLAREEGVVDRALASSAGASAGGINTLLVALESCAPAQSSTAADNLLRNTWISIGIDEMLPANEDAWRADDGLLTRNAFTHVTDEIARRSSSGELIPGCEIPITLMVTSVDPVDIGNEALKVPSVRVAIPLRMTVDEEGKAHFFNDLEVRKDSAQMGAQLLLAPAAGGGQEIPINSVIDATLATAAFPLAFSPITLRHCAPGSLSNPGLVSQDALSCEALSKALGEPLRLMDDRYIDGGVFDNIPLGPALAQRELVREGELATPPYYFYLDPELRRMDTPPMVDLNAQGGLAMWLESAFWIGFTSRKHEVEHLLRSVSFNGNPGLLQRLLDGQEEARQLQASSRLSPVAAQQLGKFGAFLDHRLRSYDYYAGIYDTIAQLAQHAARPDLAQINFFQQLQLTQDPEAVYLFWRLLLLEEAAAAAGLSWARPNPELAGCAGARFFTCAAFSMLELWRV